jgi:hypothetical protein
LTGAAGTIGIAQLPQRWEDSMGRKSDEGVPALRNEDVTGMTEDKQEDVIRESGEAPRDQAAEEFYDEQKDQAAETKPGKKQR